MHFTTFAVPFFAGLAIGVPQSVRSTPNPVVLNISHATHRINATTGAKQAHAPKTTLSQKFPKRPPTASATVPLTSQDLKTVETFGTLRMLEFLVPAAVLTSLFLQ
jgi:hypothetical protein